MLYMLKYKLFKSIKSYILRKMIRAQTLAIPILRPSGEYDISLRVLRPSGFI